MLRALHGSILKPERYDMKLTLAYCPLACSLVPYILLTEAGAEFEPMPINLGKNQHNSPEYLGINPKAKVPHVDHQWRSLDRKRGHSNLDCTPIP